MRKKASLIAMLAVLASLLLPVMVTPASAAAVTPTVVDGNPTCGDLVPGSIELKFESPIQSGETTQSLILPGGAEWEVTIDVDDDIIFFDWSSNLGVDAVFAKGGSHGNLYLYAPPRLSDTDLNAPANASGGFAALSHISFCHVPRPDLGIEKSADAVDGTVEEGGSFAYTITVGNTGDAPATNVIVTDNLNDDLTVDAVTPSQGDCDAVGLGNTISCNLGTIPAGGSENVVIDVTAPDLDASAGECVLELKNTATVDSGETEPESSNEVLVTVTGDVELTINKTIPVSLEDNVTFEFLVEGPNGFTDTVFVTILAGQTGGSITLDGLELGAYTVTEVVPDGFGPQDPQVVTIADTDECTDEVKFDNTFGPGKVKITKTVSAGALGAGDSFTFELRQNVDIMDPAEPLDDDGGDLRDSDTVTSANNPIELSPLNPGEDYTLCEIVMPGWSTNLDATSIGGSAQYTLVINDSNERVCVDFMAPNEPAPLVEFDVDNTPPPGGEARTIGFWRNWSGDCTGGNQDDVLGDTLALGTVTIGSLSWPPNTTCDAVKVLNKSTVNNGTKKANDAAYELAAQLLAAKLNVQAGAAHACIDATIVSASTLLTNIGFTGTSDYLGPKVKNGQAILRSQALALAGLLDDYNNFGC
jgi:uncharacterized repeat protein (TIGR01451 family)